jgi:apolipoprotein D and lipocalin family protein
MKNVFALSSVVFASILFSACATIPKGASTVGQFDVSKYLGKWYEIARFDFTFEKNLDNTTAEYSTGKNGIIDVKNRGFNYKMGKWQQALGKAKFRSSPTKAELEVSFFGPFYSAYNVIALDKDYTYALVAGKNLNYLWILSRTVTIPDAIKQDYLNLAKSLGYDISKLIWVKHDKE